MIRWLKELIDPFELLYLAIAIATFEHTQWAAAFMFEGVQPVGDASSWYLRGALIAIAIDVGMLLSSRFLATAEGRQQRLSLVTAFVVAAILSCYTQVIYILMHTPTVVLSAGVSTYWVASLTPLMDARVVIFPLALPVLATIYTMARLSRHRRAPEASQSPQMVDDTGTLPRVSLRVTREPSDGLLRAIEDIKQGELPEGEVTEVAGYLVDLESNAFYDQARGRAYGPYKTRAAMLGAMKQAARRPRLPSGGG